MTPRRPMPPVRWLGALAALAGALPAQRGDRDDWRRGNVAPDRVWAQLRARFDADADGKVTPAELGRGEVAFANLDRDRDGALTAADFAGGRDGRDLRLAFAPRVLMGADGDRDRTVTTAEWRAFVAALGADDAAVVARAQIERWLPPRGRRAAGADRLVRALDTDGSTAVERREVAALFALVDADGDGAVTTAELRATRRARPQAAVTPPAVGEPAPDFDLPYAKSPEDLDDTVRLSSFAGKRPVALIFGSYT